MHHLEHIDAFVPTVNGVKDDIACLRVHAASCFEQLTERLTTAHDTYEYILELDADGKIKLSAGKKRHALVRPA